MQTTSVSLGLTGSVGARVVGGGEEGTGLLESKPGYFLEVLSVHSRSLLHFSTVRQRSDNQWTTVLRAGNPPTFHSPKRRRRMASSCRLDLARLETAVVCSRSVTTY
jgi:hypothetical protein